MLKSRGNMRADIANALAIVGLISAITVSGAAEPICAPKPLAPLLASPQWRTDGFYFELQSPWTATYLLQVSTNLNDWTTFSTNYVVPDWPPWIRVPVPSSQAYVRALLDDPQYPLFNFAIRAKEGVRVGSLGIIMDSYDSADPRYSINGMYDPNPEKTKDGGDVVLGWGVEGLQNLKNSKIKGKLFTVSNTTVTLGTNAQIGSTQWHLAGNIGIEPGWWRENLGPTYMPRPVDPPFSTGSTPPAGTGPDRGYNYVMSTGDYVLNTLNGNVLVLGNARLLVRSNCLAKAIVISTNASLQVFLAGDAAFAGIANFNADVTAFQVYGLASNYQITFSGSSAICGLIYAPNASCNMFGGGVDMVDFCGAFVVRSLGVFGHCTFHFDENLKRFCVP